MNQDNQDPSKRPAVVITGISGNLGRTLAKLLHKQERLSYREISARLFEAGHINKHGDPFSASSIKSMMQS